MAVKSVYDRGYSDGRSDELERMMRTPRLSEPRVSKARVEDFIDADVKPKRRKRTSKRG